MAFSDIDGVLPLLQSGLFYCDLSVNDLYLNIGHGFDDDLSDLLRRPSPAFELLEGVPTVIFGVD